MTDKNPLAHYSGVLSEAVQESAAADVPASGAAALSQYLKDCEQHSIVPDVGGAFAFAFAAGFNLATTQAAPIAWPKDAQDVRDFFRSDFITAQFPAQDQAPCDEDRYVISAHDFLSAVNWWADFPHVPREPQAGPTAVAVPAQALTGEARAEAIKRLAPIRAKLATAAPAQAAPAAVAVPALQDMLRELRVQIHKITTQLQPTVDCSGVWMAHDKMAAALAATPAAEQIAATITNNFRDAGWSMGSIDDARVLEAVKSALTTTPAAAAPVVLPEPAEFQSRTKPDWDAKASWSVWEKCKPESAADYERTPVLHNWMYEVRKLFTEQQVRALLAGVSAPAAHEQHRELYFAAYALCDGICEDHHAIGDVMDAGSHGRLCNALAQLDSHYGVTSPEERISKEQRAAIAHPTDGVHVNAVASIYVTAGGDREFDDWRVPLPVGSNLLYTAPQAQADAREAQLLAFAVSEIRRDEMEHAPVLYVSKGQLNNFRDPDGPDSTAHGRYMPARVTPSGKFTTPLFAAPQDQAADFQQRVQPWMMACFGPEISADRIERNHRFLEESLELVQSLGCTASEAHQLVDYVFGRPVGEPVQEAGGVMVTLAALCLASGLDMHACGETELARIWTKVEAIRAKQAAKPKHSPLPMHALQAQADARDADDAALIEWLSGQYLAADFHWGDPKTPVLVIEIPPTASVCGDFRTDVRSAIAAQAAQQTQGGEHV